MSKIYIYPTDTVWGIGGNALELDVYKKIAEVKNTKITKPISLLFSDVEQVEDFIELDDQFKEIIATLSDDEITFGVEKSKFKVDIPSEPFSDTDFVCFRVLKKEYVRQLCSQIGGPITTTSLNISGNDPIVDYDDAHEFWQKHISNALFIDDGRDAILSGLSSTIVLISGGEYKFLRKGRKLGKIERVLKEHFINHE